MEHKHNVYVLRARKGNFVGIHEIQSDALRHKRNREKFFPNNGEEIYRAELVIVEKITR